MEFKLFVFVEKLKLHRLLYFKDIFICGMKNSLGVSKMLYMPRRAPGLYLTVDETCATTEA